MITYCTTGWKDIVRASVDKEENSHLLHGMRRNVGVVGDKRTVGK